jgi:hypothetical protein
VIVFEERSTYDQTKDSVATVTLTVECAPGQVAELSQFLVGVSAKAGVYSVAMDHVVAIPEQVGDAHGEPTLQPEHIEPEAAVEREGSQPQEGGEVGLELHASGGENGVVAWPAGEGATEGPQSGSA